jgi:dCMP deaminase
VIEPFLAAVRRTAGRPDKQQWAFAVALAVSTRGECTRRRVGAVIVDRNGRIAGAGYNGSEPGGPSCLKGECPRGSHGVVFVADGAGREVCRCGAPWPCSSGVLPGSQYDTGPGACHAVHAELNALLDVSDRNRLDGATLYVTTEPCDGCLKILRTTGIVAIAYLDETGVEWDIPRPFRR